MAGSMAALFLTMACLNQEEWNAAAPAMDMAPRRPRGYAVPPGGDGRTRGDGCGVWEPRMKAVSWLCLPPPQDAGWT